MLPRWHILLGIAFTALIWIVVPSINKIYLALVFLSSVLIDFDHYLVSALKTKKLSLFHSLDYHKKLQKQEEKEKKQGIRRKGDFHILHTIEFHILIAALSFFWTAFFYVFIGMLFHSMTDLFWLFYTDRNYLREYFLFNWIKKRVYL